MRINLCMRRGRVYSQIWIMDLLGRFALLALVASAVLGVTAKPQAYTDSWAVEVQGGVEQADALAKKYGFVNMGQVGNLKDIYHLKLLQPRSPAQSGGSTQFDITTSLRRESNVRLAEQQVMRKRVRKSFSLPTDPLWSQQWSLLNTGQVALSDAGNDLNIVPAWIQGVTGCNSVVAIVDDGNGVEYTHQDLEDNYNSWLGYDYIDQDSDPFPGTISNKRDSHGTSCAGGVAMVKDNGRCGVGVAYQATITGLRILNSYDVITDLQEAQALSHKNGHIEIYSNSWGPVDDGEEVGGPGALLQRALETAATEGRAGKGSIWVWAAGNGGDIGDSCAADGYASSIYTIAIGAASSNGYPAYYDEKCAGKVTTVLVNDQFDDGANVATSTALGKCVTDFDGTSAATPIVSAVIALVLEANRNLTWRDVQYLLVYTSNYGILATDDWATNAAGLQFSHQFGFGAIDAEAIVTRAQRWINVPGQLNETVTPAITTGLSRVGSAFYTTFTYNSSIQSLEHVVVTMSIHATDSYTYRGDTQVELRSASGTQSIILPLRYNDYGSDYTNWPFMTVHFWGEDPTGTWQLIVYRSYPGSMRVKDVSLTLYGTANVPSAVGLIPSTCDPACARGCAAAGPEFCDACVNLRNAETLECITECPTGFTERHRYCYNASLPEPQCDRSYAMSAGSVNIKYSIWSWAIVTFMMLCNNH